MDKKYTGKIYARHINAPPATDLPMPKFTIRCELYEKKAKITIIGIVPDDIQSVEIGLSETLRSKFDILIQIVIKSIEELGVEVTRKDDVSLESVVKELRC